MPDSSVINLYLIMMFCKSLIAKSKVFDLLIVCSMNLYKKNKMLYVITKFLIRKNAI